MIPLLVVLGVLVGLYMLMDLLFRLFPHLFDGPPPVEVSTQRILELLEEERRLQQPSSSRKSAASR